MIIDLSIKSHNRHSLAHAEMIAMNHIDNNVHELFEKENIKYCILKKLPSTIHLCEKLLIAYKTIEPLCHEIIFTNIKTLI